ncbi:MAG TPA: hypothetical protein VHV81_07050 [Steroidobacteraceae bacterium]|nr:hypothetical protein [Steroidobacteraceae bacterium]
MSQTMLSRVGLDGVWVPELAWAVFTLLAGTLLLPLLIYYAGVASLGRYEGGSLAAIFKGIYVGLGHGSIASWVVILGPFGLYLLFKGLRAWWRGPGGR